MAAERKVVHTRANNFPPPNGVQQHYDPHRPLVDDRKHNAAHARVDLYPLSAGCVAARDFAVGEAVGWLWGALLTDEQWLDMRSPHPFDPHAQVDAGRVEDFLQPIREGEWRCLPLHTRSGDRATDLTQLLVSARCPMAYLKTAAPGAVFNAALPQNCMLDLGRDDLSLALPVYAQVGIDRGDIIKLEAASGWNRAAWERRAAAAVAHPAPPLPAWLSRRIAGQQRQWENLCRFVAENLEDYEGFPYAPFTADNHSRSEDQSHLFAKGASLLQDGIIGVRFKPPIPGGAILGDQSVCHAHGVRRSNIIAHSS